MNIKKTKITKNYIKNVLLALLTLSVPLVTPVFASTNTEIYSTVSYGTLTNEIDNNNRNAIIEQNKTILITDQFTAKATGKNRKEIITEQESDNLSQARNVSLSFTSDYLLEFNIFNATTSLQNDDDRDGFYQTFSVIFDADINSDIGNVYARLYLSHDGGPWIHYYTTDNFTIYNDSEQDAYEVITTFRDDYPPGYYDILIDLYQVGYSGIVATYSADNNSALFALPLESSNNDRSYVEGVYVYHGGSFSIMLLILLLTVLAIRLKTRTVIR